MTVFLLCVLGWAVVAAVIAGELAMVAVLVALAVLVVRSEEQ